MGMVNEQSGRGVKIRARSARTLLNKEPHSDKSWIRPWYLVVQYIAILIPSAYVDVHYLEHYLNKWQV